MNSQEATNKRLDDLMEELWQEFIGKHEIPPKFLAGIKYAWDSGYLAGCGVGVIVSRPRPERN